MDGTTTEDRNALSGRRPIEVPRRLTVRVAEDCARFGLRVGAADADASAGSRTALRPARVGPARLRVIDALAAAGPDGDARVEAAVLSAVSDLCRRFPIDR